MRIAVVEVAAHSNENASWASVKEYLEVLQLIFHRLEGLSKGLEDVLQGMLPTALGS